MAGAVEDTEDGNAVPMIIQNHWLQPGPGIEQRPTANHGGTIEPEILVIHYTAGRSGASSVRHFLDPAAKASAHVVIDRSGQLWQLVPFNQAAWHAGVSAWAGRQSVNRFSIGIELDNAGKLQRTGAGYQAWFGATIPDTQVVGARHKNESTDGFWHTYTEPQITALLALGKALVSRYGLTDVVGHDDISPGRKIDPGPAFPMRSVRSVLLGRSNEQQSEYRVTATSLNLRSGPGTHFGLAGPPLPLGARLALLEMQSLWAHVVQLEGSQLEGWVRNSFISQAA